jgi:acetolactate synthase-1/2/3 large subunit
VILAGRGVRISGAINILLGFAVKYKIPIVTTYLGVDVIEYNHPCHTGVVGIKGTRAGNLAVQNADLLIVLGASLAVVEIGYESNQFAREAKIIVVDTNSFLKKRKLKIDTFILGDVKEFIQKVSGLLAKEKTFSPNKSWLKKCIFWKRKYPVCLPEYKNLKNKINIYYFIDTLSQKLKSGDVVVTDAGSALYAGSQGIKIKKGVRYVTSGGFGGMGYSLPASIGISAGLGNKRVMCINGDGSFQQNIQELQTVVHYKMPLKIFVLNNSGYLSIRTTQSKFFNGRLLGEGPKSGVSFPSTEKIAKAYGIKFTRINDNKKLGKSLEGVLKYNGPVICEIMTLEKQEVIPTVASQKKSDGTMISRPLEDMYPFLDRDEFCKNMIIKPLD